MKHYIPKWQYITWGTTYIRICGTESAQIFDIHFNTWRPLSKLDGLAEIYSHQETMKLYEELKKEPSND